MKNQLFISLDGGLRPFYRDEPPIVVWFRVHRASLFDGFHQIITLILLALEDDAAFQLLSRDTGPFGEEFTAAITPIAVHGYAVPTVFVKRRSVGHA